MLILLSICLICCGCGKSVQEQYNPEYRVGVFMASEKYERTKIVYLDEQLNEVNTIAYPYGRLGGNGMDMPLIVRNVLYEIGKPETVKKGEGKGPIVGLSLKSGKVLKYDFNNHDILDYYVWDGGIYALVKEEEKLKVLHYRFSDRSQEEITLDMEGESHVVVMENKCYLIIQKDGRTTLQYADFSKQKLTEVFDLSTWVEEKEVFQAVTYQDRIYFTAGGTLFSYTNGTKEVESIPLAYGYGFSMQKSGTILYISLSNIERNSDENGIAMYDIFNKQMLTTFQISHGMKQFMMADEDLFILGTDNMLYHYRIDEFYECHLENKVELLSQEGYFFSGCFVQSQ